MFQVSQPSGIRFQNPNFESSKYFGNELSKKDAERYIANASDAIFQETFNGLKFSLTDFDPSGRVFALSQPSQARFNALLIKIELLQKMLLESHSLDKIQSRSNDLKSAISNLNHKVEAFKNATSHTADKYDSVKEAVEQVEAIINQAI